MNYIKLHLGGKERGAKLGLGFLQNLQEEENIDMEELFKKFNSENVFQQFSFINKLIYHSLKFNCERANEEVEFDYYNVLDWIDEVGYNKGPVIEFIDAFKKSIQSLFGTGETELEGKEEPQAKKAASINKSGTRK